MSLPEGRDAEDMAAEIFEEADKDESSDDLTRGTEVYEEDEMDYDEGRDEELDLEPRGYSSGAGLDLFEDEDFRPFEED